MRKHLTGVHFRLRNFAGLGSAALAAQVDQRLIEGVHFGSSPGAVRRYRDDRTPRSPSRGANRACGIDCVPCCRHAIATPARTPPAPIPKASRRPRSAGAVVPPWFGSSRCRSSRSARAAGSMGAAGGALPAWTATTAWRQISAAIRWPLARDSRTAARSGNLRYVTDTAHRGSVESPRAVRAERQRGSTSSRRWADADIAGLPRRSTAAASQIGWSLPRR